MRPFTALLRAIAITVVALTACSSQVVVGPLPQAEGGSVGSVSEAATADDAGARPDQQESSTTVEDSGESEAVLGGWVSVPGSDVAPATSEFLAKIDALSEAVGLQTTFSALSNSYGASTPYREVRESNAGESGGTYRADWRGEKVLANDTVWTADDDRPNLFVGVDAREKDEQFTNDHLLKNLRDSVVEVVGFEQAADGSARWYLLVDPAEFMGLFDDWDGTGTVFDFALSVADVDPSGALTAIEMDLGPALYARFKADTFVREPYALRFAFEAFDARLPLGPPCDDPTAATDDRSRPVLHCPIDGEGFVAPHVSVGYLDDASAVSQAYLVANLLGELGYSTEVLAMTEGVDAAYDDLAANNIDLYASGWFPVDESQLARDRADAGTIGEAVERFDVPLSSGASISSLVVTTEWAEAEDISSINDINADPALYGELDTDGNGKGEIEGCPVGHSCRPWLEAQIASVWTNLELTDRSYQTAYNDLFLAKILGNAALAVATVPDPQYSNFFGDWSVVSVSNGIAGIGEEPFGSTCLEASGVCRPGPLCRAVAEQCLPAFAQADLEVVANSEWLAANPVGAALVEQMEIDGAWLHAVADDGSVQDSDTGLFRVNSFGADDAADGWMSSREALIAGWVNTALAVDPNFGTEEADAIEAAEAGETGQASEPDQDSATDQGAVGVPPERLPPREGDLLAWEQAVLAAVQNSGALERADSTELLSLGAAAVCDAQVDGESLMQLFDAARGRFVDLDAQIGPFLDLIQTCELKPSPSRMRIRSSTEAVELPEEIREWRDLIAYVQQSGVMWGSIEDVEIMTARSCIGGYPRLADHANGYWIGDGMLSTSQMQTLAALLDGGCELGSDTQWRALVLFDTGRDELRRNFGPSAVGVLTDAQFECMVGAAARLGRPPVGVDAVAAMAPVCAPAMVIEADTVRYTSDLVPETMARCVAEGLVGLASSTGDPSRYFGRWLSPVLSGQQDVVSNIVRGRCGLTDDQVEALGIFGL